VIPNRRDDGLDKLLRRRDIESGTRQHVAGVGCAVAQVKPGDHEEPD